MQEAGSKAQDTSNKAEDASNKSQDARGIGRWVLVVLWMGVIFAFSAQPQSVVNLGQGEIVSKLAHVTEYAILGWLIQRARGDKRSWWLSLLIAVAYAVTDEFHQSFVPGRHARGTDVLIDVGGVAIGLNIAIRRTTPPHSPLPAPHRPR
jgi:VanZ family protein